MNIPSNEKSIIKQGNVIVLPIMFILLTPLMFYLWPTFILRNEVSWAIVALSSIIGIVISLYVSHKRRVYPFGNIFEYKSTNAIRAKFKKTAPEMCDYLEKNKFAGYIGVTILLTALLFVYFLLAYKNKLTISFDKGLLSSFLYIFVACFSGYAVFTLSIYIVYFWRHIKNDKI